MPCPRPRSVGVLDRVPEEVLALPLRAVDAAEEVPVSFGADTPQHVVEPEEPKPCSVVRALKSVPEEALVIPVGAADLGDEVPMSFGAGTPQHVVVLEDPKPEQPKRVAARPADRIGHSEATSAGLGSRKARGRSHQVRALQVLRRLCQMLECEGDGATKEVARRGIAKKLAEDPYLMLPMLLACLEGACASVREQAVEVIGLLAVQDLSTVAALVRILSADEATAVRAMAAEALGSFRSQADLVVPALRCQYHMDESADVRESCARSLAAFDVTLGDAKADAVEGSLARTGTPSLSDATDTASEDAGEREGNLERELVDLSENVVTFGDDAL